ncbi:MAG: hypothetical protein VKJ64_15105, partial [Leptolyngbyaceae bacterium]|nr:hypothetical protein [Leptolyngbyaceae bacterium]
MSDFVTTQDSSPFAPQSGLLLDPFNTNGLGGESLLLTSTSNGLGGNPWESLTLFPEVTSANVGLTTDQLNRDLTGLSDDETMVGEADITALKKIKVRGKKETIRGTNGKDIIDASKGKGKNRLLGLGGNDTLIGGKGDRLDGGKGNDTLAAGQKSLQLQFKGGAGDDIFKIFDRLAPQKSHTILDFDADSDRLWFRNASTVSVNQTGSNTIVIADGKAIVQLRQVSTQILTQEQFMFVGSTPEIIGIELGDPTTSDPTTSDPTTSDPTNDSGATTVQIVATDDAASEPLLDENDPGVFTVRRSGGDLSQDIIVNYTIDGTAESSTDYTEL